MCDTFPTSYMTASEWPEKLGTHKNGHNPTLDKLKGNASEIHSIRELGRHAAKSQVSVELSVSCLALKFHWTCSLQK